MKHREWKGLPKATLNERLAKVLRAYDILKTPRVREVILQCDRSKYVPSEYKDLAFYDSALPIGFNATISAPHMHAMTLEYLKDHLKPNARVLDVGSGSGILCALFMRMMGFRGLVVGIEHIEQLSQRSKLSILDDLREEYHNDQISLTLLKENERSKAKDIAVKENDPGHIVLINGDGRQGVAELGPYNCIHVGAALSFEHKVLLEQLAAGGRMMAPVYSSTGGQEIVIFDKDSNGKVTQERVCEVRFIPLTSKESQLDGSDVE
jgi:protein-L-isoaspartate(D-aspartate) O-methyltransferase